MPALYHNIINLVLKSKVPVLNKTVITKVQIPHQRCRARIVIRLGLWF